MSSFFVLTQKKRDVPSEVEVKQKKSRLIFIVPPSSSKT